MLLSTAAQHVTVFFYIRKRTEKNFVLKQLFIFLSYSSNSRPVRAREWGERKVWLQFKVICSCQNLYELNLKPGQALITIIFKVQLYRGRLHGPRGYIIEYRIVHLSYAHSYPIQQGQAGAGLSEAYMTGI